VLAASLAFVLWFWGGYAAILITLGGTPLAAAAWPALLCFLAMPVLLLAVVEFVALPKHLLRILPRPAVQAFWLLGNLAEATFPWLGWTTLLWLLHGGRWGRAMLPAAGIAAFSYLTGFLILLVFRPRPASVQLTRLELALPGLPAAFDGYRLLHISDLHVGRHDRPARVRARLAAADGAEADLVVFTGDLTDDLHQIDPAAETLASLPARDGTVAVLGNHDNWLGAARVRAALRHRGLTPLVNQHLDLHRGEATLHLVGVDNSAYAERDDIGKAMAGMGEEGTVILLSHAPDIVLRPLATRAALVLCGHTHGGQISLPLYGPLYVPSRMGRRYASGLFPRGEGWLFVNRGLGEIFPALRVLCPREIALITLRRA
jgi:hypothetical protein